MASHSATGPKRPCTPAEQGRVQVLFPVGGSNDNAALVSYKAVQVAEQHSQQPPCSFMHL